MKSNHFAFLTFLTSFILLTLNVNAQDRLPLHADVYDHWNNLEKPQISNNGNFISYEINPQSGDGFLLVHQPVTGKFDTIHRASEAVFSPDNNFIVYKVKPFFTEVRKAKLEGKKKDDLPKDSLGITSFNGKNFRFAGVRSFSLPAASGNCVAALFDTPKPKETKDTLAVDSLSSVNKEEPAETLQKKGIKGKKKDKTETFTLKLLIPADSLIYSWDSVTAYTFSDNGRILAWASYRNDSIPYSCVSQFETSGKKRTEVLKSKGYIRGLALDTAGIQLAFLHSSDTAETKRYRLNYYNRKSLNLVADTASDKLPEGFSPGEHGKVWFSQDGSKLYFGITPTPRPEPKDTLTDDEKARVDVWHWKDPLLQPQQLKKLDSEKKRTFLTVFHPQKGTIIPLADEKIKTINTGFKGNGIYALGFSDDPYLIETSWQDANYRDVYLVNNETGTRELLLSRHNGPVSLSTTQKYLAWYSQNDSLWFTMNLKQRKPVRHSAGESIAFYDVEHDVPSTPGPVGYAGWTCNDRYFVVYDQFDLWGLEPSGKSQPELLTRGEGRKYKLRFRNINLNPEVPYSGSENGNLFLSSFSESDKSAGFHLLETSSGSKAVLLINEPCKFSTPLKAGKSDILIWSKSNFYQYPDLWMSDMNFTAPVRLSDANPQQKNYLWGSVELVKWNMPDGKPAEGLLYRPEGFDPAKKYPMLVYFYERQTDQLHQHYVPKPSRSIISPAYCSSNGYLVFVPDISYRDGFPGQSAYDAVISGTEAMIAKGFVDKDHMGLQGQSWGGYQTAWIVTRSNLYKAAMAGAPVSNMTSAYGGIRWESGVVRQSQYEEGQSRIGATLWERPDLYVENSPLFRADKIETPLLIMSNDGDGAVPWYQGIELFTALRRLEKPVWLLNYNGDEHNLSRRANMKDLDTRMMQFFDHYLKDAPAPEWMVKGIPAVDKGKKTGFGFQK